MQSFRTEFPDFPVDAFPTMPPSFEDTSWHNDACPSITSDLLGFTVFIDYPDPAARELFGTKRFSVMSQDHGVEVSGPSFDTDDWNEVLAFLLSERFVAVLREWLPAESFAEMKRLNETADYASGCCASQNYCDANMAMLAAFVEVLGRPLEAEAVDRAKSESDVALWNAAWEMARKNHIGIYRPDASEVRS